MPQEKHTEIQELASLYQEKYRQYNALKKSLEPLQKQLKEYGVNHQELLENERILFDCGTYLSLRTSRVLDIEDDGREVLIANLPEEYLKVDINDKAIIESQENVPSLRRMLKEAGATIADKSVWAVYAG